MSNKSGGSGAPTRTGRSCATERFSGSPVERSSGRPGGRVGGLGRDHVADVQRSRMIAAMADVAAERGLASASVAHVVARAGVSRRTYYDIFEDREDCFLAALDSAIGRISERVLGAWDPGLRWRERIRQGLLALLEFLDEEPTMGRLLIVESLGAGPAAIERRGEVLRGLIVAVDEGRGERRAGPEPTALTAEGIVGAVVSVIHARMVDPSHRPLTELAGPLMSLIVQPYLGSAASQREAQRPVPTRAPAPKATHNPLKGLEMRLTYRTMWVLLAVGANPGASNKQIGLAAGAEDQGQISKLLSRLERLGLVHNTGAGHTKGAANAWTLTARGEEVNDALAIQTSVDPDRHKPRSPAASMSRGTRDA